MNQPKLTLFKLLHPFVGQNVRVFRIFWNQDSRLLDWVVKMVETFFFFGSVIFFSRKA